MTVGIAMGISTMAAAALGNTISDVAGVGLGGFIESMATKLGLPQVKLSRCDKRAENCSLPSRNIMHIIAAFDSKVGVTGYAASGVHTALA